MKNLISKVDAGSIAEEVGIEVNDVLISINGTPIDDIIDYKFLAVDEEVVLEIEKPDGEVWEYEIEKEYGENLGLEFQGGIMDKAKSCSNKCMFCFIDQLPKGMRDTLYFKDDDSRLSFLQGNFVTLTNMKDEDIDRIIRYKISPINISVHTTNPELRVQMLKNRFAGSIMERLRKLREAEIEMHAQVVCIPNINNGEELRKTVTDLYELYPYVKNVAVVPIGITKFRENLPKLDTFTKESAKNEIMIIQDLQRKFVEETGAPFVRLSDEFYITAGLDVPNEEFYSEYDQLEDGVGMIRYYREVVNRSLEFLNKDLKGSFSMVTGELAYNEIKNSADRIMKHNPNINIDVYKVINNFFGNTITVAGLLTGTDIIDQLKGKIKTDYLIMSSNMFRKGYELAPADMVMLDDLNIHDIEEALNVKVIVCDYTGDDLIDVINANCKED
jgi:putative radical SAM enzyme (TIGR03279 family)